MCVVSETFFSGTPETPEARSMDIISAIILKIGGGGAVVGRCRFLKKKKVRRAGNVLGV